MSPEFLEKISMAEDEIENGDFVTWRRINSGNLLEEHIITFSGIEVKKVKHASNASTKRQSKKNP